jgi:glyoxylase-like metal-dependent hydrolase (beta-lactamase superfamily II)
MREVVEGVFEIPVGFVNVHMIVTDDGVVLVDTGLPRRLLAIEKAFAEARKAIGDIRTILLTHRHPDHVGNVALLRERSGATVVAHAADAPAVTGEKPVPPRGIQHLLRLFVGDPATAPVDAVLHADGPTPVPGFSAVHTPGHTAGHVSYLLDRAGGVLFAGDAVGGGSVRRTPKIVNDDSATAAQSARKLAGLRFEVAVFGHGAAVTGAASERFRQFA